MVPDKAVSMKQKSKWRKQLVHKSFNYKWVWLTKILSFDTENSLSRWLDAPVRPHVAVGGQAGAGEAGEGVPALVLVDVEVP